MTKEGFLGNKLSYSSKMACRREEGRKELFSPFSYSYIPSQAETKNHVGPEVEGVGVEKGDLSWDGRMENASPRGSY